MFWSWSARPLSFNHESPAVGLSALIIPTTENVRSGIDSPFETDKERLVCFEASGQEQGPRFSNSIAEQRNTCPSRVVEYVGVEKSDGA